MKEHKLAVKKLKASIKDYCYIAISVLILATVLNKFDIKITPKATVYAKEPEIVKEVIRERFVKEPDNRVLKLRGYLEDKGSPLAKYAELIISEADKYALDWTKIVAISKIESDYGKKLPEGSHNAWGLGGSKFMYFPTWEEGIQYASWLIGTHYKQAENQGVKYNYCPESSNCNPAWASVVTKVSKEILALEGKK